MAVAEQTFQQLTTVGIEHLDPEIAELLGRELERQRGQIELIASENFTWPAVMEAIGSTTTNKYAEGYSRKLYSIAHYGVSRETNVVDYDEVLAKAHESRPRLIVCGGSAYPRTVETAKFREIADEVGALLLCDMAHFAGLVAAGLHPNPVEHCD